MSQHNNPRMASLATSGWSGADAPAGIDLEDSRQLSRSYTIFNAMRRLGILADCQGTELRCLVLGADRREGSDNVSLHATFEPLREMLTPSGCTRLHIVLCGPNCEAEGVPLVGADSAPPSEITSLPVLTMEHSKLLFHDHPGLQESQVADLAVAFNAGMWGYDTWATTIQRVTTLGSPLLVTSYSIAEAESDEEAMVELGIQWAWAPSINPWRSLTPESRTSPGDLLYENAAWQCVTATS